MWVSSLNEVGNEGNEDVWWNFCVKMAIVWEGLMHCDRRCCMEDVEYVDNS